MDAEWIALRSGVKPALQRGVSGSDEAAAAMARFTADGFCVAESDASTGRRILYVAARQEDAEALRDAEAPLLLSEGIPVEREAAALEEVGRRLGYPDCCVARRVMRNRARRELRTREVAHEDYRGAVDAWVERPPWELNRFALRNDTFLVTFEPCTYDCASALALARAVLAVVSKEFPQETAVLTEKLRQPFLVGREHEQGAFAVLDRSGRQAIVADALPSLPAAAEFAAKLRGCTVGPRGAVGEAVLLDFAP